MRLLVLFLLYCLEEVGLALAINFVGDEVPFPLLQALEKWVKVLGIAIHDVGP